jgi:Phage capsid protein
MSNFVNAAFVQQYSTNVMMLLQQQGSRLRNAVQDYSFQGKAASVAEQFGQVTPVRNQSRHSDTPLISTPQDKRWIYPNDYDWADLIDNEDKLRMLIDPTGPYSMAGAWAMGRAIDDEIISGVLNANNTGENGTTSTGTLYAYNSNSQSVAAATGAASTTGLNIAKLRAAKRILLSADLDIDNDQLFCVITAKQHDDLLNEAQAVSLDYNNQPVLVQGKITSFMGFNFIHSERIPGGANFNTAINPAITSADSDGSYVTGSRWMVPVFAKSGVALGMWNDIQTSVDKRADKRNSYQVYVTGTFGATRLEEKRCVLINCK